MTQTSTRRTGVRTLTALTLALLSTGIIARAQTADANPTDCSQMPTSEQRNTCIATHSETKTIYLQNASSQDEADRIRVAVQYSFDPSPRVNLDANQNALIVTTYPAEMAKIEAMVHTLDRPGKAYRLAFTITELDGEKTISTQHVSMVAVVGEHTTLKQGDKVPLATGVYSNENSAGSAQTQFTYLDVGTNFDATITEQTNGVSLKSKIEESSVSTSQTIMGVTEPVIRQTVLQGTSLLTLDKPTMLGSIDVPNSTRHYDIAVVLQPIK